MDKQVADYMDKQGGKEGRRGAREGGKEGGREETT